MEVNLNSGFVKDVFARVRSSTGSTLSASTTNSYVNRIMALVKLALIGEIGNPDEFFESLRKKYENSATILTTIKPVAVFVNNLTPEERVFFKICDNADVTYRSKMSQLNREAKEARARRVSQP